MHPLRCATLGLLLVATTAAPAAAADREPVYLTAATTQAHLVRPPDLFFTADNGPRMSDIHWVGWGRLRAVGYGAWLARSPGSVGDDELDVRPANIVLTRCPGQRFYSGLRLTTWDSSYRKHVEGRAARC